MKRFIFGASATALAMLVVGPAPASAQADTGKSPASKCEWQSQPQYGPRAPLRAPVCIKADKQREQMKGMGGPECDPAYKGKTGRWEWRSRPQYGPRAPLQPPVQTWVEAC